MAEGLSERLTRQCHSDFHSDVTSTFLLPLSCSICTALQTLAPACSGNAQASFEAQPCGFLFSVQSQSFQISPVVETGLYCCMTDIDEAKVISFRGVRTDRHEFGILIWKHVGTQKNSTQSSKLGVSCRSRIFSV